MPVINISVENKIAEADGTLYVCDNSDFVAKFAFDAEWEAYENKTARFVYNNSYVDVVFTGNECPVPIISGTYFFNIGVYAGNLHTTTPARVPCKKSILCGSESESSASQEVRNEFLDVLDKRTGDLSALQTTAKDSLVAAINEAARTGGAVKGTFYVTVTQGDGNSATADKTAAEVYAAYAAGYAVYAIANLNDDSSFVLPLASALRFLDAVVLGFAVVGSTSPTEKPLYIAAGCSGRDWSVWRGTLARTEDIPTIPTALKNPNALTIKIGSTAVTYDGSTAQTVTIADGTEVSY